MVEGDELDLEHVQCPRIEDKSLDGYHGWVTYLCPVENLLDAVGIKEFFTTDPAREESGRDAVVVSEGRHEVEWVPAEYSGDEPWLRLKDQALNRYLDPMESYTGLHPCEGSVPARAAVLQPDPGHGDSVPNRCGRGRPGMCPTDVPAGQAALPTPTKQEASWHRRHDALPSVQHLILNELAARVRTGNVPGPFVRASARPSRS